MLRPVAALTGLLLAVLASPSHGQDMAACARQGDGDAAARFAACTRVIEAEGPDSSALARAHFYRGYVWLLKSEPARAVADLTVAVALDPRIQHLHHLRGLGEFYRRNYRLAVADFDAAVDADPADLYKEIWRYLAAVRVGDVARARYDLADRWKRQTDSRWPEPIVRFLVGRLGPEDLRRFARRGTAGTQTARLCEADYYIGQWHTIHGRFDKARGSLQQAVAACPKTFYEYLGAIAALKTPDGAAGTADPATAVDRQTCVRAATAPDERLAACDRAIAAGELDLYQARGIAHAALGDGDRAIADFGEAIRRDPGNPRLYISRADAWHAKGETYKAMPDYNAALHLAFDAEAYAKRGREWLDRGIYTTAIGDFTSAIRMDPRNAGLFAQRALAWEKKGETEKATADRDRAARLAALAAQRRPD